ANEQLGASTAYLGDLTGDGVGDLAIGSPGFDGPARPDRGAVHVHSGVGGALLFRVMGQAAGDLLGSSLAHAGDVDQ
ncbi:hypothetical protein DF186_25490, partial [Enterococcus hirae]